jgi:hypothetical protein
VVPVLIINLERDAARRDALTARLDALNVPYRIHKAIAGKDLSPDDIARYSPKRELAFERELNAQRDRGRIESRGGGQGRP